MSEQCCNQEVLEVNTDEVLIEQTEEEKKLEFLLNKEERSLERLDICKSCEYLIGPLNNCTQCGCFMNIKVRIYSAKCSIGKW